MMLVEPTIAAGMLDAVGVNGFTALLHAQDTHLDVVAQRLRDAGAMAVARPAASVIQGDMLQVQLNIAERMVEFHAFATVCSRQPCPLGRKAYYEIEIMEGDDPSPQYGFASVHSAALQREKGHVFGVGNGDGESWAVDGTRQLKWNAGSEPGYQCKWKEGDVVGLACDLEKVTSMQMLVSVNGSFEAPNGHVFDLDFELVGDGLFAAFTGQQGKVRYNLGEAAWRYQPPGAGFVAYSQFADTEPPVQ